jgi:hypothetical protein
MYLQKGIGIKTQRKQYRYYLLKVTDKKSRMRIRQKYGTEDPDLHPDPYQNVTDPERCL